MEYECYEAENGLTKLSTETLIHICHEKVKEVNAYDPRTAVIIFVYDSEYKHNIFQLCVYYDQEKHCLTWRPFVNNALGEFMRRDEDVYDFLGSFVLVEINDMNLNETLMDMVAKQKITEGDLERINRGGKDYQQDAKYLQEMAKETLANSNDPGLKALPSVLDGYGMPGNNPYLNHHHTF